MQINNFTFGEDNISVFAFGDDRYRLDIHNCYDFESFSYNIQDRELKLRFRMSRNAKQRQSGNEIIYLRFALVFEEVTFFQVRELENIIFMKDTYIDTLGFTPIDNRNGFNGFLKPEQVTPIDDFTILFQSKQVLKVNCQLVEFVEIID